MKIDSKLTFCNSSETSKYGVYVLLSALSGIVFGFIGIYSLVKVIKGEVYNDEELSMSLLALGLLLVSDVFVTMAQSFINKFNMCKTNYITITEQGVEGKLFGKGNIIEFNVLKSDILSYDVVHASANVGTDGIPLTSNLSIIKKLTMNCVKYLVIYTTCGNILYIGMLPSVESVEHSMNCLLGK